MIEIAKFCRNCNTQLFDQNIPLYQGKCPNCNGMLEFYLEERETQKLSSSQVIEKRNSNSGKIIFGVVYYLLCVFDNYRELKDREAFIVHAKDHLWEEHSINAKTEMITRTWRSIMNEMQLFKVTKKEEELKTEMQDKYKGEFS